MAIFKLDYNILWDNICNWSRKVGRTTARPVLLMWYVMESKDTPRADKWAIFTSLAYIILPLRVLNFKKLSIIGWLDDVVSLTVLIRKMVNYVTPEMELRADEQLDKWFPKYTETEMIEMREVEQGFIEGRL